MRPALTLLLILLPALASPAWSAPADGARPRPRRMVPAAKPAEAVGLRPALGEPPPAPLTPLPPPPAPGGGFASTGLTSGGLASGGLRSTLPILEDAAAQCRAGCARSRIACDAAEGTADCPPRWSQCAARCDR